MLKKQILSVFAIFIMLFATSCSLLQPTPDFSLTITSEDYITKVKPLITTLTIFYGDSLSAEQKEVLEKFIAELDKQAAENETIDVMYAILALASPILLDQEIDSILSPEEAQLGLLGLDILYASLNVEENPYVALILSNIRIVLERFVEVENPVEPAGTYQLLLYQD